MMLRARWNSIWRRAERLLWLMIAIGCTGVSVHLFTTRVWQWKTAGEFALGAFLIVGVICGIGMIGIVLGAWPARGWFTLPDRQMRR